MIVLKGNYTKQDIKSAINHAKRVIAGVESDTHGIGLKFWSTVAYSLFTSIFTAFLVKSKGEIDDLGQFWKPLSPEYKAYGRPDARRGLQLFDNRAVHTPNLKVRPTLSPAVNRAWGGRWFALWLQLTTKGGDPESSGRMAGGSTWEKFKAKGYPTLLGLTHNLKLPILNRTGTLQRSLFPAPLSGGIYVPIDPNQIFRPENGKLTIGTKRPHISTIDADRPLWPDDIQPWLDKAVSAGRDAIYEAIPDLIGHP